MPSRAWVWAALTFLGGLVGVVVVAAGLGATWLILCFGALCSALVLYARCDTDERTNTDIATAQARPLVCGCPLNAHPRGEHGKPSSRPVREVLDPIAYLSDADRAWLAPHLPGGSELMRPLFPPPQK